MLWRLRRLSSTYAVCVLQDTAPEDLMTEHLLFYRKCFVLGRSFFYRNIFEFSTPIQNLKKTQILPTFLKGSSLIMWMEAHNPVNSLESLRESLFHQNDMQSILASIFAIFSRDFDSFFRKSISVDFMNKIFLLGIIF